MKKFKKLLALGLALIMCLGMATTAFAAGEVQKVPYQDDTSINGTITIKNATIGNTYSVYQLFDATVDGDGDKVAYTTTKDVAEKFEALTGNVFKFDENTAGSWNVSIATKPESTEVYSDEEVIAFLQSFVTEKEEGESSNVEVKNLPYITMQSATATSETIEFTNVPLGYYLVASSLGATITLDAADASATIIDKNQNGPSWDGNGKVIVNEDAEDDEKEVTVDGANYGDTVQFKVSVNTTNYDGADPIIEYTVKDVLGSGMSYVTKEDGSVDVTVTVGDRVLGEDEYSIAYDKTIVDEVEVEDTNSFIIKIKWNNYNEGEEEGTVVVGDMLYASPSKITVEYQATVGDDAVIADEGNKNTANFGYTTVKEDGTTEDKGHEETNKKETTTYVYALGIVKTNLDSDLLDGATFTLALNGKGLIVEEIFDEDDNSTGVYRFVRYANPASVDGEGNPVAAEEPTPVTTVGGKILVKGVEDGLYTLTETKAPAGYNALVGSTTVEAELEGTYIETVTDTVIYDENNNIVTEETETTTTVTVNTTFDSPAAFTTVVNFAGTLLPSTGGIGTTIFYVVGGLLVAGAGILLITRKRMSKEQ